MPSAFIVSAPVRIVMRSKAQPTDSTVLNAIAAPKAGDSLRALHLAGLDEAAAIVSLMRVSRDQTLGILEQARFVVELLTLHGLSVSEVAEMLSCSKAWVSMRRGLLAEMGDTIQRILFQGTFPAYCYMYTLRAVQRMNSVTRDQLERFIQSVAGRRLSVREIELLAHGYFRGPRGAAGGNRRRGRRSGRLSRCRRRAGGCRRLQCVRAALLKDLQLAGKYLQRVLAKCQSPELQSRAFHAQAHLLTGSLLVRGEIFQERMREFHDRCGRA